MKTWRLRYWGTFPYDRERPDKENGISGLSAGQAAAKIAELLADEERGPVEIHLKREGKA